MIAFLLLALQDPVFEERKIATIPEGRGTGIEFSLDTRRVVFDFEKGSKKTVWIDDGPVEGWESAKWPNFAEDGRTIYYQAKKGGKEYLVWNGTPGEAFDRVFGAASTVDGKRFAHRARLGGREFVVLDGKRGEEFDEVDVSPAFSENGAHLAYKARAGTEWFVVLDGKKTPPVAEVVYVYFRGDELVYLAKSGDRSFYVVGGAKQEEFDTVTFPANAGELVYAAEKGEETVLVRGGKKTPLGSGMPIDVALSADGKVAAAAVRTSGFKTFVIAGDRRFDCESILVRDLCLTPDGSRCAWIADKGDGNVVWADGKRLQEAVNAWRLSFSPSGEVVFRWKSAKGCFLTCGDRQFGPFEDLAWHGFHGKRLAFVAAKDGKYFVQVGDWKSPEFDYIVRPPRFSSDGKKVAFGASVGRELWWKVLEVP